MDDFRAVRQGKFEVELTIDGVFVDSASDCAPRLQSQWKNMKNDLTFLGFPASRDGNVVLRSFVFNKVKTTSKSRSKLRAIWILTRYITDDDSAVVLSAEEMEEASSIRISITQKTRIGERIHDPVAEEPEIEILAASIVPEDSKPAKLGLSTG